MLYGCLQLARRHDCDIRNEESQIGLIVTIVHCYGLDADLEHAEVSL